MVSQNHGILVNTNRHTCYFPDFCLFAPPEANTTIGDSEGVEVAWCTKKGHGARLIPEGTLQGVQLVQSPGYVQIVGFIDQTKLNIATGDYGGELDSGGQDGVSVNDLISVIVFLTSISVVTLLAVCCTQTLSLPTTVTTPLTSRASTGPSSFFLFAVLIS